MLIYRKYLFSNKIIQYFNINKIVRSTIYLVVSIHLHFVVSEKYV